MASKGSVLWSIKEIVELLKARQMKKFDCNIGVSGKRGDGKSTLLFEIFHSFEKDGFDEEKHQVYTRDDVINLLASQKMSYCWDDEAINSGYKREFQNKGQQELIKIVTNYRDNFNIYGSALPFFYSLDKDLRELMFMHIHIIERGCAVILLPLNDQIHMKDPWDTDHNIKVEQQENKRMARNPKHKFRYHKFSTFAGYLYFHDMTDKQRERYEEIKKRKRAENFKEVIDKKEVKQKPFYERVYDLLIEGKVSNDGLHQMCAIEGESYTNVVRRLNEYLRDKQAGKTLKEFFREAIEPRRNKARATLAAAIPNM